MGIEELKVEFLEQQFANNEQQSRLPEMTWPQVETSEKEMSLELINNVVKEISDFSDMFPPKLTESNADSKPVESVAESGGDFQPRIR